MPYTYPYPRPAVTVDIVLLDIRQQPRHVLLIKRRFPPFQNTWAFPGGFMDMDETLLDAAHRELFEETGIKDVQLTQFRTYDAPDRDPRHRTLSTVFYGFTGTLTEAIANDDAQQAQWFAVNSLPELAFDHAMILHDILGTNKLK